MSKKKVTKTKVSSIGPSMWYCESANTVRIVHPSGLVEALALGQRTPDEWFKSAYTEDTGKKAVEEVSKGNKFEGYI